MLSVWTLTSTTVLTITREEILNILKELEQSRFPYEQPIEYYQIAKDKAIFDRTKYHCSLCPPANEN